MPEKRGDGAPGGLTFDLRPPERVAQNRLQINVASTESVSIDLQDEVDLGTVVELAN